MSRAKLNIKDIAGNLFKDYNDQYKNIIQNYKNENAAAQNYREDIKNNKLADNKDKSMSAAYALSEKFKKELLDKLNSKKTEYAKNLDKKKADEIQAANHAFTSYASNTETMKALNNSIQNNTSVMQAIKILDLGYTPAIEKLIENNSNNENILQLVEPYINKNIKPEESTEFNHLQSLLEDARTTEVDDIDNMLKTARYFNAQQDTFPTLDENLGVVGHNMRDDFNTSSPLQDAKNSYFE